MRYKDNHGAWSDWSDETSFTTINPDFTFVHITDEHIGWKTMEEEPIAAPQFMLPIIIVPPSLREVTAYANFTDTIEAIAALNPKPKFILSTGDNVDYANPDKHFLDKFKSLTQEFTEKYDIPFYFVPGNHDRYTDPPPWEQGKEYFLFAGNDKLRYYHEVMGNPASWNPSLSDVSLLFEDTSLSEESKEQGYNRYNYMFEYMGYLFIGLDSGEDYLGDYEVGDLFDSGPEGGGFSTKDDYSPHIQNLERTYKPKIIFMHHPIYTGQKDDSVEGFLEDSSIVHYREEFIDYCKNYKVKLVLSGHTHAAKDGTKFIQTPSATKDGDDRHGYRVIEIKKSKVDPHPYTPTPIKNKRLAIASGAATLHTYDSEDRHTGFGSIDVNIPNSYYTGYYGPSASQVIILYDTNENYKFETVGTDEGIYELSIASIENEESTIFVANDIPTSSTAVHQYTVDWKALSRGEEGVTIQIDSDGDSIFERSITSDNELTQSEFLSVPLKQDVTAVSQIDKFGTRFDRRTGRFSMMATWTNTGDEPLNEPLQMVIESIIPDTVTIANADGTTDDGKPYFDFSNLAGDDGKLDLGETSEAKQLIFNNPSRARFEFDVSCWANLPGGAVAPARKPLIGQPMRIHFVIPLVSDLGQNFPNPFNPETWIPYELAEANDVKISIYDIQGRLVRTIDLGRREIGQYFTKEKAAYWNGKNNLGEKTGSGVYFYQIQAGDFQAVRKMVIVK